MRVDKLDGEGLVHWICEDVLLNLLWKESFLSNIIIIIFFANLVVAC